MEVSIIGSLDQMQTKLCKWGLGADLRVRNCLENILCGDLEAHARYSTFCHLEVKYHDHGICPARQGMPLCFTQGWKVIVLLLCAFSKHVINLKLCRKERSFRLGYRRGDWRQRLRWGAIWSISCIAMCGHYCGPSRSKTLASVQVTGICETDSKGKGIPMAFGGVKGRKTRR